MFIITADHDDRVVPLHSYKYMAELQYKAGKVPGQRPLLIRIQEKAGHGGTDPSDKIIKHVTEIFTFIARVIGFEWK